MMDLDIVKLIVDEGKCISAFLKNNRWMGCIKGMEMDCLSLTRLEVTDQIVVLVQQNMRSYLREYDYIEIERHAKTVDGIKRFCLLFLVC